MAWAAVIAGILSLVGTILAIVIKDKTARETDHEPQIQELRKAVEQNDAGGIDAALADQHDRVLAALRGSGRGGDGPGEEKRPDQAPPG